MTADASYLSHVWAFALIDQLVELGVRHYFVAPGSRSTPLTLAVARHPGATAHVHFDERGTAYMALGAGRASGTPAAWITTSGTAVANGFPAVVEADVDGVPLLLLTADRPPELRATGANQTIDQVGIFGKSTRWFFDLPVADASIPVDFVRSTAAEAFGRAVSPSAGPVHLNVMFREPLVPVDPSVELPAVTGPTFKRSKSILGASSEAIDRLSRAISGAKRGLIVAGRIRTQAEARAVAEIGRTARWPVLADVLSQLRFVRDGDGAADETCVIHHPDMILAAESLQSPDVVVHFGDASVSKRLMSFVAESGASSIAITSRPARVDPFHKVGEHIVADFEALARDLIPNISEWTRNSAYLSAWRSADHRVETALQDVFGRSDTLTEPAAARVVTELIPADHALMIGSSMPIRDVDSFAARRADAPDVFANRGASGIDGTVATALGIAQSSERPATVILGDLALLHDINSLAAVAHAQQPIVIVVVNNDGGGIFSFLPVAQRTEEFERFFGTPHGLGFEHAAKMFGIPYHHPKTVAALRDVYSAAIDNATPAVIEICTDRQANVEEHRRIVEQIKQRS